MIGSTVTPPAASPPADLLSDGDAQAVRDGVLHACLHGVEPEQMEGPDGSLRLVAAASVADAHASMLLADAVTGARHSGHSWATIGGVLGISKQAAQQRFGAANDDDDAVPEQRVLRRITAFNEMAVLHQEQAQGWHLVGFGAGKLVVAASDHPWEHERLTFASYSLLRRMEADGWQFVGSWGWWSYLKRPAPDTP